MLTQHPPTALAPTCAARAGKPAVDSPDDGAAVFEGLRRRLFGIACRMLGSFTEAEDVVQDVWLRWQGYDRKSVINPTAFLVTTTTRLAINATQTARARHETSVGDWADEPVDSGIDPSSEVIQREEVALGIGFLLEWLSPTERAAYLLREAFEYPYAEIASILDVSEVNARQLVCRAGRNLVAGRRNTHAPICVSSATRH